MRGAGIIEEVRPPSPSDGARRWSQAFEVVANERQQLLAAARSAINEVLLLGLDVADGLDCIEPAVRDLCVALERCLEHYLLPPILSLSGPSLWHALSHLQHARRRRSSSSSQSASADTVHLPGEAVALAKGLCEKHLSRYAPHAPSIVRERYAARLWLCLALQRRVVPDWISALALTLPFAYADGSLLTTIDDRDILIDLLAPLSHVSFRLPARPPRRFASFLAIHESASDFLPPELGPERTEDSENGSDAGADTDTSEHGDEATDTQSQLTVANKDGLTSARDCLDDEDEYAHESYVPFSPEPPPPQSPVEAPPPPSSVEPPPSHSSTEAPRPDPSVEAQPQRSVEPQPSESALPQQPASQRTVRSHRGSRRVRSAAPILDPTATTPATSRGAAAAAAAAEAAAAVVAAAAPFRTLLEPCVQSSGFDADRSDEPPLLPALDYLNEELEPLAAVPPPLAPSATPSVPKQAIPKMPAKAESEPRPQTAEGVAERVEAIERLTSERTEEGSEEATTLADCQVVDCADLETRAPAAEAAESEDTLEESKALQVEQPLAAKEEEEEIREVAIACGAVEPAEEVEAITRVQATPATSTWQEIRSEIVEGRYTAHSAVRARAAAEESGTPWHAMMLAADGLLAVGGLTRGDGIGIADGVQGADGAVEGELLRERLLGACAHVDRLPLPLDVKGSDDAEAARESTATAFAEGGALSASTAISSTASAPSSCSSAAAAPPALLHRACPRRGLHMIVGVSGLLSPLEGDMRLETQPMTLSACWAAAAAFFGVGDWWSLTWGGEALNALAQALREQPALSDGSGGDGIEGSKFGGGGGKLNPASVVQALAVRGPWTACYDAAKAAGAALAARLRARGCGARPVTLLGVSLGARVVWHCLEVLAALPNGEGDSLVQDVLLVAAPVTANPQRWERVGRVVCGRLVNAYVPDDAQLGVLYRMDHLVSKGCCGLGPVASTRVESYDATPQVAQTMHSYHFAVPGILEAVGLLPLPG